MSFIGVIEDDQASGRARELFVADLAKDGYVWNLTRVLAIRPQVLDAWRGLVGAIRNTMDCGATSSSPSPQLARCGRATACSRTVRSCASKFFDADRVAALSRDPVTGGPLNAEGRDDGVRRQGRRPRPTG